MARSNSEILTGLEIGTSSVKVVIGEAEIGDDLITIHGYGECPSGKVMKGDITDVAMVQEQVMEALSLAEQNAGKGIRDVFLAITGGHVESRNSRGTTPIRTPDRRITEEHYFEACRNARNENLPVDCQEINTVDRRFLVDGHRETVNPVNMVGGKLEAEVHTIFGQRNAIDTVCTLVNDVLSYPATDMAFSALASSYAVLSPEELEAGALVIDIGAGVTEYALFHGPGVYMSGQITVGCNQIVNDLSIGLDLPPLRCRNLLKKEFVENGSALMSPDGRNRILAITSVTQTTPRNIPFSSIEQIVELRLRELFEVIRERVGKEEGLVRIGEPGIVLTGGGACIPGVDKLAYQVFGMPVSIGRPRLAVISDEILNSPRFATPVGLLRLGRLSLEIGRHGQASLLEDLKSDLSKVWSFIRRAINF
jgi:cell division protein FtsA